jgi:hypothetical protein
MFSALNKTGPLIQYISAKEIGWYSEGKSNSEPRHWMLKVVQIPMWYWWRGLASPYYKVGDHSTHGTKLPELKSG